jgi:hypothetical protein
LVETDGQHGVAGTLGDQGHGRHGKCLAAR